MDLPANPAEAPNPPNLPPFEGGAPMESAGAGAANVTPTTSSTKPGATPVVAMPPSAAADAGPPADPPQPTDAAQPPPNDADDWPSDCDYKNVFVAHGVTGIADTTKYRVEPGTQELVTFIFAPPWGADRVQLLAARPLIDNKKIVHHWSLYSGTGPTFLAGAVVVQPPASVRADPTDAQLLLSGGPGGGGTRMPDDVGMRIPTGSGVVLMLEVHYFNPSSEAMEVDATGVEVCATATPRPIEAALHFLGTQAINLPAHAKTNVVSVCNPAPLDEPVHVMSVYPHMHLTATHAKITVQRSAAEETLFDEPYTFTEQRTYPLPRDGKAADVVINSGERLTTTCSYDNQTDETITYGEFSEKEMCLMMLWAWPAGKLHSADAGTGVVQPDTTCGE